MRFFDTPAVRQHLLGVLNDSGAHPKLVAAALQGCEGRTEVNLLERVRQLQTHADHRVRRAAIQVAQTATPLDDPLSL